MELFAIFIIFIFIFFVLFIINQCYKNPVKKKSGEKFVINDIRNMKCYNDPLTLAKCHITKEMPCPDKNGSFMQCTNNFKREVNIADCLERSYYYSPGDERLSEKCVYKEVFPFAVKTPTESTSKPTIFPRVNIFRNKSLPMIM